MKVRVRARVRGAGARARAEAEAQSEDPPQLQLTIQCLPLSPSSDCDASDSVGCEEGLVCGTNNCDDFHPNLAAAGMSASTDCCKLGTTNRDPKQ